MENNTLENIQAQIDDLKKELLKTKSWSIIIKLCVLLLLFGVMAGFYKCRTVIKWCFIVFLVWLFFGNTINNAFDWSYNVIRTMYLTNKQQSLEEENKKRELEEMHRKARIEADKLAAIEKAKQDTITAEAEAKVKVLQTEEQIKKASWEREQAEARNNAINQAIINGTWTKDTPANSDATKPVETTNEGVTVVKGNHGTQVRVIYTN